MPRLISSRNTTRRSFDAVWVGALLIVSVSSAGAEPAAAGSSELALTLRVCRSGPAVATARAERALGAAEVGAVEPLQNPSLVLEHQQSLSGPAERETIVGAEIPLSISGRRGLLREAASARSDASNARATVDRLATALDFRRAFAVAALEQERALVLQKQQRALEELSVTLKQLAARGETAGYDVRRHDAEVRLHARALASARARANAAHRQLGQWLDPALVPGSLSSAALARAPITPKAGAEHPELGVLRASARAAELEANAAHRRWVPEPEVFAGYRQVTGGERTGHGVSLGLSVPLTFFEHGQGAAARAGAERALMDARAARLKRALDVELHAAAESLDELEAALRDAELNVANTEALAASARVLYGAGEASITDLLDAYRTGEHAALDRVAALEELVAARLALMRAAGKQFDPELDASCGSQGSSR
jgi:cobalt-zinc-cadmium efflux system outer membrane protein